MVVGVAMLLAGHSAATGAGLGIPKSPSFHSGLELAAAAKDISFQDYKTISNTTSSTNTTTTTTFNNITEFTVSDQSPNNSNALSRYWSKDNDNSSTTGSSNNNPFAPQTGDYSGTATMPSFTSPMAKVDTNGFNDNFVLIFLSCYVTFWL